MKIEWVHFFIVAVCIAFQSSGLFGQEVEPASGYEVTFPSMGTLVSFKTFSADEKLVEESFKKAREEVDRLEKIFTDYDEESETRQLTREEKVNTWQQVSPEMWEVLRASDEWNRLSDGAFDASVGQLSILWRKARRVKRIPDRGDIEQALKSCGWKHVELDADSKAIRIKLANLRLDFGAIAKGYIIERAYQRLLASGLPSSMVRAGGDLRLGDAPPGREGWRIEIANIDEASDEPTRMLLANAAVSSSGDLHQYMEVDGVRRSHVLDPRTGIGVEGPSMVTVVARDSMTADVADTTICVMGHEAGMKLAKKRADFQVRMVSRVSTDGQAELKISQHGFDALMPRP